MNVLQFDQTMHIPGKMGYTNAGKMGSSRCAHGIIEQKYKCNLI